MAWDLILHVLFLLMSFALVAMLFNQLLCITDLEADHMNPFEATSAVNKWVLPEFLLQGVLCLLCLLTGHWILFLLTLPVTCYNATLFMKRQHLLDVTEVFRNINFEKNCRMVKLALYFISITCIVFRFTYVAFEVIKNKDAHDHEF